MQTIREQLAWAAGFFDGEGGIFIRQSKNWNPGVVITVTQKDEAILRKFQNIVGLGNIYMWNGPHKDIGHWRTASHEYVQQVVCMLWPWLSVKKRQQATKVLIEYREWFKNHPDRWRPNHNGSRFKQPLGPFWGRNA